MKAIKSYTHSFSIAWNSKKLTSLIYLLYLFLAILLTLPFYRLFSSISEYSLLPADLMKEFNATAFGDMIRDSGKVFQVYIKGFWPWLLVFWFLGTYLYGGIISWISNPKGRFNFRSFMDKCNKFFWKFLRIALYILIVQAVFAVLIYIIPVILVSREGITDEYMVRTMSIAIFIHLFFIISISLIADLTRYGVYRHGKNKLIKDIWRSVKYFIRNIASIWLMYLMWVLIPIALIILFVIIRKGFGMDTVGSIIMIFIMQQLFVWLRYYLRVQKQAMLFKFYIKDQLVD